MEAVFLKILNMSINAGWLVLAVIFARLLIKKAPKWLSCLLWGLVGLRLVMPFSIKSSFSLLPSAEAVPGSILTSPLPKINTGLSFVNSTVNPVISDSLAPTPHSAPVLTAVLIASAIWLIGVAAMLIYSLISYLKIKKTLRTATVLEGNIFQSENVPSPFILGILSPKIYLPYRLSDADRRHIIAHETAHLKRRDHLIKPFAFLLLSVYWFNPLLWVAYVLLCRDIELACDERVVKDMQPCDRREYSLTLVNHSLDRRKISACPLAFGEADIKQRVKNVMNYKKPAFWIVIISVILCIAIAVCFLTAPAKDQPDDSQAPPAAGYVTFESVYTSDFLAGVTTVTFENGISEPKTIEDTQTIDTILQTLRKLNLSEESCHIPQRNEVLSYDSGGENVLTSADDIVFKLTLDSNRTLCFDIGCGYIWDDGEASALQIEDGSGLSELLKVLNGVYFFYSPTASATFHYIFKWDFAFEYTSIKATCDSGALSDRDVKYPEKAHDGSSLTFKDSHSIYWLPNVAPEAASEANIAMHITTKSGEAASVSIRFTPINNTSSSTLGTTVYNVSFVSDSALYMTSTDHNTAVIGKYTVYYENPEIDISFEQSENYVFEASPENTPPVVVLEKGSNRFRFTYSLFSSYLNYGTYEETDGVLTMTTYDGMFTYVFERKGDALVFDADSSSEIPEYRYSSQGAPVSPVPNGAKFVLN